MVYGIIGYGTGDGSALDYSVFGTLGGEIPAVLKGKVRAQEKSRIYKGQLLAGELGRRNEGSSCIYARLWRFLTKMEDTCGDLLSGSGVGAIATVLYGRNVLCLDGDPVKVGIGFLLNMSVFADNCLCRWLRQWRELTF